jgi:hypothetical protein
VEGQRVAVTLVNARSHVVDVPEDVDAATAAAVLRGERSGAEVGWAVGESEWLSFGNGQGWVRRDAIAEIAVVDYAPAEETFQLHVHG